MPETRIRIPRLDKPNKSLEAAYFAPHGGDKRKSSSLSALHDVGVVLLHPHPKLGGDMDNNVVVALARALARNGYASIRLNFRGIGESQGSCTWSGSNEREDVKSVCAYARDELELEHVYIVGYSFGSVVGANVAASIDYVRGFTMISPPWGYLSSVLFSYLYADAAASEKPKLLICGTQDNFTGVGRFKSKAEGMAEPKDIVTVPHVDHFWFGKEKAIVEAVLPWLAKVTEDLDS